MEELSEDEQLLAVEKTTVFPSFPRTEISDHPYAAREWSCSRLLGDGMNDLAAMTAADVGISVDTATQAAKESADVILLKKDLNVLEQGILEGRKAFANMLKYIRITASSNFGNIFSIVLCQRLFTLPADDGASTSFAEPPLRYSVHDFAVGSRRCGCL